MNFDLTEESLKGWKVAIVEDEPDNLRIVEILFESVGAEVITAKNGEQGLKVIHEHMPRFVISDLSMPKMNGHEMVKRLKADPTTADIPIIGLSAYALDHDRAHALKAGFHNYITKPISPETFVKGVLEMLLDIPDIAADLGQDEAHG